jgi:hypothetical protein
MELFRSNKRSGVFCRVNGRVPGLGDNVGLDLDYTALEGDLLAIADLKVRGLGLKGLKKNFQKSIHIFRDA